jgi:GMP synthase (glutamine-hydrolysing)
MVNERQETTAPPGRHRRPRSAIGLRHVAFEDLGLLAPALAAAGWDCRYRDAPIDDLDDPAVEAAELLIVLGGPIGAYEINAYPFLVKEIALLERRLSRGLPTLGICLGSQLIAKALGARVFPGHAKEIGWGRLTLTEAGLRSCLQPLAEEHAIVLHWHGDTFDLPAGATRLAADVVYENQAFVHGESTLALQFHIEADPRRLEAWFVGHAAELSAANVSVADLRATTAAVEAVARSQAERVFGAWLGVVAKLMDGQPGPILPKSLR